MPKIKFKMAAAAILNSFQMAILNILPSTDLPLLISTTIQNFMPVSKFETEYYNNFLKFKMVSVRHVGFSKTRLMTFCYLLRG